MATSTSRVSAQMDKLYEFDREPVDDASLKPGRYFAGLFAGEHVAGTEFVIGAFFVLHGVTFGDLAVGLFIGNLLAVLSWTFICAPIAVRTRLTLYWYLRRIAGPVLTAFYNLANAALYCVLAGAMIAVGATAVGIGFGLPTPALDAVLPESPAWIVITFALGAVVTLLAVLGFKQLSRFAGLCAPWIFVSFVAGAIASFPALGVAPDLSNFREVMQTQVWNGTVVPGQEQYGLLHVMFFAWFANLAMHIGLSDMALFRYAKSHWYGLYSAFGMYTGHMLAWFCSGIMVAAVAREMNPGLMAYEALGVAGAAAVLVASWTTANPTLYRAGLALQVVSPNWPRWKVTAVAGLVTTILACFPVIFLRLLDYVAYYGLILMPIGAVVLAEHWILPRFGIMRYHTEAKRWRVGPAALIVWPLTLIVSFVVIPVHLYFKWLPGYVFALSAYVLLQWFIVRRHPVHAFERA